MDYNDTEYLIPIATVYLTNKVIYLISGKIGSYVDENTFVPIIEIYDGVMSIVDIDELTNILFIYINGYEIIDGGIYFINDDIYINSIYLSIKRYFKTFHRNMIIDDINNN